MVGIGIAPAMAACGGGPGNVEGAVRGFAVDVAGASLFAVRRDGAVKNGVFISNQADLCAALKSSREPKNLTGLFFVLLHVNPTQEADGTGVDEMAWLPVVPGEYPLCPSSGADAKSVRTCLAFAGFQKTDASCKDMVGDIELKSGLVTVESVDDATGAVAGRFDLTFGPDRITGEFDSTPCDVVRTGELSCE